MYELEATADVLLMTGQGKSLQGLPVIDQQAIGVAPEAGASREARLVQAVLAGDRDMYGSLYQLYAPLVHGILLARLPRSEVEDMVQEIFLHALTKLHTLRDAEAFGPWIGMIARNRAMDFHRRSRETVEVTDDLEGGDSSGSKAAEILEIILSLPDTYRETLVLRLVEGMTGPEIATRTGLTSASVRVNLHRGMKLLRAKLGFREGV
ncbi:MAG: sigma-70 family RNA polymerase sigma factor [Acidobacteriota bacterium]|nr:sigma-70 family RNA polymerase sigma factor [Acidobacteriota bacterium]